MAEDSRCLRFGVFELDLRAGELRKQGLLVRLQEQPFKVLEMLLQHPGEVVTREELRNTLWPADTFVDFDHGLNKAISKIRDALGDSAQNPRFLETVARRGYRFLAEVRDTAPAIGSATRVAAPPAPAAVPPPAAATRRRLLPLLALLLLLGSLAVWRTPVRNRPRILSLAVLPLESLSNDVSQDYFADGMTDELISNLGQIRALRVISRTSIMGYKHSRKLLPQIAAELNVDAVVEGTVLRFGDQIRITAQLIEAASDRHLWSASYQGELRETLALQKKVAGAIADQIRIRLSPQEQAALNSFQVVNPAAYESYLKGRYFWNKRTAEGLKAALVQFHQAIDADPQYARAYSGLADTYALLGDWEYAVMAPKEALPKAKAAALRALQLDDSLGEAHNSLAFCLDTFDWDFDAAGKEFQRAIELSPGYATAHHWYAWHLSLMRQPDQAIAEMRRAESLDPLSLIIKAELAELLVVARSLDASIEQSRRTLELDADFALAHNELGEAYIQQHRNGEAVAELQRAVQLSGGSPVCIANLARAYVAAGARSEAVKLLGDLQARNDSSAHAPEIAAIHASLGDSDRAMTWLERAYAERFNPSVLLRPGFDPLREDLRFQELARRIGLPR